MEMSQLRKILSGLEFSGSESESKRKRDQMTALTVWVPRDAKARYDRIQSLTNRQFSKKVRDVLLLTIEEAEEMTNVIDQ